ncbi:antibiotic biosynthesis monooxygenase [Enterococcus camelliae]|uniref:Antibiotic biosynthesis monooxygenase n=1 Tax=Enterococcus camelliae TaxID=453959 RepID=A0ABW5TLC0_9ENTE
MYLVTNTINVKKSFLEQMVNQFRSSHTQEQMQDVPGFLGFEVFYRELPDEEDVSEIVALSRWENEAAQLAWLASDSFKSLHQRRKAADSGTETTNQTERPVLGNTIRRYYSAE